MLYFLQPAPTNSYSGPGQLWSWPAWTIRPPTSEPLVAITPPTLPVRALNLLPEKTVSPEFGQDGLIYLGTVDGEVIALEAEKLE